MDLIDLEDESIDAEVMDSLAVTMDDFRVKFICVHMHVFVNAYMYIYIVSWCFPAMLMLVALYVD